MSVETIMNLCCSHAAMKQHDWLTGFLVQLLIGSLVTRAGILPSLPLQNYPVHFPAMSPPCIQSLILLPTIK